MQLHEIVETSRRVAAIAGRRAKIELLASCLARAAPGWVEAAVGLLSGAPRQGKIGIGYATLREARQVPPAASPTLTLAELDDALDRLLQVRGKGTGAERARLLQELFARATADEQDFLVRLLLGELRQGALEGLMIEAIAKASALPVGDVRRAVMMAGDAGVVAKAALGEGVSGLARFAIELFRPIKPMLAQPAEDLADALGTLGHAALEYKLDGARVQAHKAGADVRVFSRRLNEVTAAVPEIVAAVQGLPVREAILDGEAIALRPDGWPQPFQITMRRFGRKLDVGAMRQSLPLRSFYFDLLALDGTPLIDRPAGERVAALRDALPDNLRIPRTVTEREDEAAAFASQALAAGHEGVMAKALEAPYEAGARGKSWLKIKTATTLDLVVLAAEWGNGRRQGWLSNLHLGARDPANGGFVMLGKTFKGMTDQMLAWQTEQFLAREIARDRYTVYVRPELVVEIAFNDLQASPHYPGGLALRFARVKAYRPDKRADEADTIDTVRAIYQRQAVAAAGDVA
ncbi:MAG TPA: ATP-dependent DNA ligase [Geminicoccaceae bacterium]|nr:ATP-dependent DNA ligase [Geminicoccaceae bacterium]